MKHENNHILDNKNEERFYMIFAMSLGLFAILVSFFVSTILFKGVLVNPIPVVIILFSISAILMTASFFFLIWRFAFKRKELGKQVADLGIFIPSIVFYLIFGVSPSVMSAAEKARIHCPEIAEFYSKKKGEGKHPICALTHTARKMLRIVWALLKTGQNYSQSISN